MIFTPNLKFAKITSPKLGKSNQNWLYLIAANERNSRRWKHLHNREIDWSVFSKTPRKKIQWQWGRCLCNDGGLLWPVFRTLVRGSPVARLIETCPTEYSCCNFVDPFWRWTIMIMSRDDHTLYAFINHVVESHLQNEA